MDRGQLLSELQRLENNYAIVHHTMHHYYQGVCSLEHALIVSLIEFARVNEQHAKQAMLAPPPIYIIKRAGEGET
jgi:hypothetical protein